MEVSYKDTWYRCTVSKVCDNRCSCHLLWARRTRARARVDISSAQVALTSVTVDYNSKPFRWSNSEKIVLPSNRIKFLEESEPPRVSEEDVQVKSVV